MHAAAASVNNRSAAAAAAAAAALAAAGAQPLSPRSCALHAAEVARAAHAARGASAGAAAVLAAPGAVSDGGGFSPRGGGPRGPLPRLLSRNSTGGLSIQASDASGPFIHLVRDVGVLSPRPSGAHRASLDM